MISQEALQNTFSNISSSAHRQGAEVELTINEGEKFSATYQDRKLKKYNADQTQTATLRVLKGHGVGVSTTENLSAESLQEAFAAALQAAKELDTGVQPGEVVETLRGPSAGIPQLATFVSDYEDIPIAEKLQFAETLEKGALDFDSRVTNVPYSGVVFSSGLVWLLNSKGINQSYRSSSVMGYSYALAKEGDSAKSGYYGAFVRRPADFHWQEVAETGAKKALAMLNAVQPPTGAYPVVLSSEVASQFLSFLGEHVSAKSLEEGTSLLKGRQGEQVLSPLLTLIDDALLADLPGARPFDAEGTPSQRTPLFEKGVFTNFITNDYLARKLNLPLTGHAARSYKGMDVALTNLVVTPGEETLDSLLNKAPEMILITSVSGLHSGMKEATGDFSLPADGFMYRNGQRAEAIEQFVISGNLFALLKSVSALSNHVEKGMSSVLCPDLFVPSLSIAGKK